MMDEIAKAHIRRYGVPDCLHVPVEALDEEAISTYVGNIARVLNGGSARRAFLVETREPPLRDTRLPIWNIESSEILYQRMQVWVDVTYTPYRRAYRLAFPHQDIGEQILSHTMNRR